MRYIGVGHAAYYAGLLEHRPDILWSQLLQKDRILAWAGGELEPDKDDLILMTMGYNAAWSHNFADDGPDSPVRSVLPCVLENPVEPDPPGKYFDEDGRILEEWRPLILLWD
jgi:hypothetical protein